MIIAGIDPSLEATGVYWRNLETKQEDLCLVRTKPHQFATRFERYRHIELEVMKFLPLNCDLVAIEGYSLRSHGNALSKLVENGYNLRLALLTNHIPLVEVTPMTLKAYATGIAGADKLRVREAVLSTMPRRLCRLIEARCHNKQDDIIDAYVLARIAFGILHVEALTDLRVKKMCARLKMTIIASRSSVQGGGVL